MQCGEGAEGGGGGRPGRGGGGAQFRESHADRQRKERRERERERERLLYRIDLRRSTINPLPASSAAAALKTALLASWLAMRERERERELGRGRDKSKSRSLSVRRTSLLLSSFYPPKRMDNGSRGRQWQWQ